ncbi:MAG: hypothetical protein CM15mP62_30300 [Rhodospirillaceae bacterium]|nr:MAG: hypothetical protein CM15mP62_30300 [Rhodospirillaceae bacterium]
MKGAVSRIEKFALVIITEDGCRGEYVTHWCSTPSTCAQTKTLAPKLIGRHAEEREGIYDDMKRELGNLIIWDGAIDIALWDWAGKQLDCSVSVLLGGYRKNYQLMLVHTMEIEMVVLIQRSFCRLCRALFRFGIPCI